jgi:hypothetical protein
MLTSANAVPRQCEPPQLSLHHPACGTRIHAAHVVPIRVVAARTVDLPKPYVMFENKFSRYYTTLLNECLSRPLARLNTVLQDRKLEAAFWSRKLVSPPTGRVTVKIADPAN